MSDEINQSLDMSGTTVLPIEIHKEMRTSFLEYSMSVIVARALPDVRDGLKPVHRRILYAMNEAGLTPNRSYKKSAWTVGEVLGKYHPHGDTAVYDTMVRMAQDWAMRVPLVDGQGNFGSVDGDGAAAMRYTESRLQKVAMELLRDLDKETVDFGPNYDESLQEPLVLPARYPNLLVNGSAGIAVGMATNIPPHNMREVIDAATMLMDNPDATIEELMTVMHGPDFPTGGDILGRDGIRSAFETGRGSITIRGRAKIEQTKSERNRIVITEIPYQVNKSKLVAKIAELVREKKLTEISDLRDESDRKGMRVVLELKRDAIPMVVLNKLFKHTQLQQSFGIIMLSLVDGVPKVLNLKEMLYYYIEHQKEVITRRTAYELRKARERAHILEGLVIALDNIDEVIAIIRASADDTEAKGRLSERFGLSEAQCDAILEMRLRRLTGLERGKIMDELAQLREKIAWYEQVLGDVTLVLNIIKDEMAEIKEKFGTKRRTDITTAAKDIDIEDLIAEEDMVVTITQAGYIKRLPAGTYRQQHRGGKGISGVNLKSEDLVQQQFVASTHDYVMFFSSKGKVYRLKIHELPLGSRHARGTAIVNLLPFEQGEKVAAVINTRLFSDTEYLMFATSHGIVKKTNLKAYDTSRRDGIIAINLDEGDELVAVRRVKDGDKVIMASTSGKAIRFAEDEVRPMGRGTRGVRGMNVKGDDRVLSMEMAPDGSSLLVVTTKGYGKRTPVAEYREMHRGGQGVKTISVTDKKGPIAAMKVVWDTDLVQLVSEQGITIKVSAGDISSLGRATQGVKVMNVADEDSVQAIARRPADKKDPAKKAASALDGQPSLLDGLAEIDSEADLEDIEGFDQEMVGDESAQPADGADDVIDEADEDVEADDEEDDLDEGGNE